jgi:hypothetical protein
MSQTYEEDLIVTGAISAGNIQTGLIRFTPEPNVPTPVEVTGLSLRGTGPVQAQITAHTSVPGLRVIEVSVSSVSDTGFTAWIYRTNANETNASYLAWRDA